MFHGAILQWCWITLCFVFHARWNVRASSRNASFVPAFLGHLLLLESSSKKCVQWHSLFGILLKCAFTLCLKKQTKPNAFRRFDLISVFTHLRDYFNYNTENTVVTQAWVLFPNLTRETFENNLWTLLQNILGSKRIFCFSAEVYLIHVKLPAWEGLKRGVLPHVLVSFSSELL